MASRARERRGGRGSKRRGFELTVDEIQVKLEFNPSHRVENVRNAIFEVRAESSAAAAEVAAWMEDLLTR